MRRIKNTSTIAEQIDLKVIWAIQLHQRPEIHAIVHSIENVPPREVRKSIVRLLEKDTIVMESGFQLRVRTVLEKGRPVVEKVVNEYGMEVVLLCLIDICKARDYKPRKKYLASLRSNLRKTLAQYRARHAVVKKKRA